MKIPGRHSSEPFRSWVYLQDHEGIPASSMARSNISARLPWGRIYAQFMALARQIAPEIKNKIGSLAALRKAPFKLTPDQKRRLERLFAAFPALEPLHQEMHRLDPESIL